MRTDCSTLPAPAGGDVIFRGGERGPEYWIAAFIKAARTENTRISRIQDLDDAARVLGIEVTQLLDLSPEGVAHFRDLLTERGQAPATVHRKLCSLRGLYRYCIARRVMDVNPADTAIVPAPRVPDVSESDWLTLDEARRLVREADRIEGTVTDGRRARAARDVALILTMLLHGLRVSELIEMSAAEPEDWPRRTTCGHFASEDGHTILKVRGKGGKIRRHPAHREVTEAIGTYLHETGRDWTDTGPLWLSTRNRRAKPIPREAVWHLLRKHCKAAGITKRIGPHSLRHSAITYALDSGASVARVADYAGHTSMSTTYRYFRDRDNLAKSPIHRMRINPLPR